MQKENEITLANLKPGDKAIIRSFKTEELFLKLMEMGCIPGENIEVLKAAPFNDPISVSVAGYTLSLRKSEAEDIFVSLNN